MIVPWWVVSSAVLAAEATLQPQSGADLLCALPCIRARIALHLAVSVRC